MWEVKEKTGLLSDTGAALLLDQVCVCGGNISPTSTCAYPGSASVQMLFVDLERGLSTVHLDGVGEVAASICWSNKKLKTAPHQTKDSSNLVVSSRGGQVSDPQQ